MGDRSNKNFFGPVSGGVSGPAGVDTEVQFNDGGVFGGHLGLEYKKTTSTLDITNAAGLPGILELRGSQGTLSAPTISSSGDILGRLAFQYYNAGYFSVATLEVSRGPSGGLGQVDLKVSTATGIRTLLYFTENGYCGIGGVPISTATLELRSTGTALLALNSNGTFAYVYADVNYLTFASSNGVTGVKFRVHVGSPDNAFTVDVNGKAIFAKAQITGLQVFANNAAAVTGGLAVGDLYRTGADPDVVCVVH